MRFVLAFLALFPVLAWAQQSCTCTNGCTIVTAPYPGGPQAPMSCKAYVGGASYSAPTVLASSIPLSNAASCTPASPGYNAVGVGYVACSVPIPAQPAGAVTVTVTASNTAGESPQSAPFTFISNAGTPPTAPTLLRVK